METRQEGARERDGGIVDIINILSGICFVMAAANVGLFVWCWWLQGQVDALRARQIDHYDVLSARIAHRRRTK